MRNYNSYHTAIKTSYALGLESQILPDTFTNSIPRSTAYEWRNNINPDHFVGSEFANQIEVDLEQVKILLDKRLKKMRNAFVAFARLYLSMLNLIGKKNFDKLILQNKEIIISLVDNLPSEINHKLVCRFLNISEHQFKIWKSIRKFKCSKSLIGYCKKRFPFQISQKELDVLQSMMTRKYFSSWKISSVWGYAVKHGHTAMSRTSWYRYANKFGFSEKRKTEKKTRKKESVKASKPDEIWHADITEFVTADNVKFYIHTVLDNFSRKILAYTLARDKKARTRILSFKEAFQNLVKRDFTPEEIDLIVDGGSENNNFRVHNFIRNCEVKILKKIALKDVRFSNAMIEGNNKILKQYLKSYGEIHSNQLPKIIEKFFNEYNTIKPHYVHWTHTPNDVYENPLLANIKPDQKELNRQRLQDNRISCCTI